MRRLFALLLLLAVGNVYAQVPRPAHRPRRTPSRRPAAAPTSAAKALLPAPTFLARQGAASLNEMMVQPPAFSYGSSINIWVVRDGQGEKSTIREVAVTGHADSPTCRHVSGMVMSTFLERKRREPDDLFVAGAAHLVNQGDRARQEELEKNPKVQAYIEANRVLTFLRLMVRVFSKSAGVGSQDKSALDKALAQMNQAERELEELSQDADVQAYIRESRSAEALYDFVEEAKQFSQGNGLVVIHQVPYKIIEEARARLAAGVRSGSPTVIAFDDLLKGAGTGEAAFITPVLMIPSGRPLKLTVPLARLTGASFEAALGSNRDDVENAIIGNARQRLAVFNKKMKGYLREIDYCKTLSPERMREVVELDNVVTATGVEYEEKADSVKMSREVYCKMQIPLNIKIVKDWITRTKDIIKRVDDDAKRQGGSRLQDFNYTTLIDSMLRDWQLPVARSQEAFDTWRQSIRRPAWDALTRGLQQMGVATDIVGGEQMIFKVEMNGANLIISPMHVIDMARSVVVADAAAGATKVLDAWSLRSTEAEAASEGEPPAHTIKDFVRGTFAQVAAGNREKASEQLATAFSLDPGAAFSELSNGWLNFFPDTRARLREMQREVQPVVEAAEWWDSYARFKSSPESKQGVGEYLMEFRDLLESYPRVPVDLHLNFALELATAIAASQNAAGRQHNALAGPPDIAAWDVIEAYGDPPPAPSTHFLPGALGTVNLPGQVPAQALAKWRQKMEAGLRQSGFRGQQLTQMLSILEGIELSDAQKIVGRDRFLGGRKLVSLDILADPAALILKAVQTVKERDPEYWALARRQRDNPQERSREWLASDQARQRQLTLFELAALDLSRLENGLRKSYWGKQAARYLWAFANPDMSALATVVDAAVGDGRTGSSSAYLGPQANVKLFLDKRRKMDTLTRMQNAASLQSGSEALLELAKQRMEDSFWMSPFRDSISLKARVWFEAGDYNKAVEALFINSVPVALYHPDMRYQALPGDAVRKSVTVKGRREGDRIVFAAEFEDGKTADVLAISGLPEGDATELLDSFAKTPAENWSDTGKVSDQILLTPVLPRPLIQTLRTFLEFPEIRLRILKSMVYGRTAPGEKYALPPEGKLGMESVVSILDQVKGEKGVRYTIPPLAEVMRIASGKLSKRN